jgi:hypothetical protein
MIFSFVRILEKNKTTTQINAVPAEYHMQKDQEVRFIIPVTIPSGIPIIRPNPTIKEGAIAISGFLAREKRIINSSNPRNSRGLTTRLVIISGTGNKISPVAGLMVARFIESSTVSVDISEMTNPGKNMARLFPIQISLGVSVVAQREAILPFIFSFVIGRLEKAQMKVIRIDNGR